MTLFFVIILIFNEFEYFLNPDPKFHFVPDADFEAKLQINIDMTVAMRCDSKSILEMQDYAGHCRLWAWFLYFIEF